MKQEKKDIGSFRFEELKEEMTSIGEKAFRAKQVYEWLHVKLVRSFDEMTNLSKPLRESLHASMRSGRWRCLTDRCLQWMGQISFCSD